MNAPVASTPARDTGVPLVVRKAVETFNGQMAGDVRHAAKRCLVDWIGLAIAGCREEPCRILQRTLQQLGAGGGNAPLSSPSFALMLGMASHVLDYDDTDFVNLIHVSSTLFPALFAIHDGKRVSGDAMLRAFVAGYEAEDRIGFYLGRKLTARGWHVSGVIGHLGSALAAGLVLGLDPARLVNAVAISGTASSGLISAFGTMSKPLQLGRSASDGLVAAQLAKEGFSGPGTLLDSDPGFGRPFVGEAIVDFDALDREWGRPYALLRNSFKPHASCMITHPIIDAASLLRNDLQSAGVEWDQLSAIECHVNPLAPHVAGNPRPATGLEGKFSVAYCCLLGLIDGSATPDKFSAAALGRSAIRESLPRVSVRTNADIGEQQAKVVVTTREGDVMAREVAMAKGNPANPMTDDELGDKFIALVEPVLGPSTRPALRHLWDFEKESDACAWFAGVMKTGMAA